jgi:hypothetical protein
MKTKIVLSLIAGSVLFSGCMQPVAYEGYGKIKMVLQQKPMPPKIQKHSVKEYRNMSFKEFFKNIYAKPIRKYSNQYLVNCRTLSGGKIDSTCVCPKVAIEHRWMRRDIAWQEEINSKLKYVNNDIKNELNKFCVAKNGFIENDFNNNKTDYRTFCRKGNKILFSYKQTSEYGAPELEIYLPKTKESLSSILEKHGAVRIGKNKFDVNKILKNKKPLCNVIGEDGCGTPLYPILAIKFDNLEAGYLEDYVFSRINLSTGNPYDRKIKSLITNNEIKNKVEYSKIVHYGNITKKYLKSHKVVIYYIKDRIIAALNPETNHLFLVDDSMMQKINSIIKMAKMKKQIKKDLKENLDY